MNYAELIGEENKASCVGIVQSNLSFVSEHKLIIHTPIASAIGADFICNRTEIDKNKEQCNMSFLTTF